MSRVEVDRQPPLRLGLDDLLAEPRPLVQPVEVGGPQPAHRAGEQTHERITAARVSDRAQRGDQVEDLGGQQQPAETDDLVGNAGGVERLHHRTELGSLAAQHCCRRTRAARRAGQPVGEVCRLLDVSADAGDDDVPDARVGTDREGCHIDPRGRPKGCREVVGHLEDGCVVAPGRRQLPHRSGRPIGELGRETGEGRGARSAPAVDRLVGVADGSHRDPAVPGREERPQQDELGLGGVLELIEQHDPESGPLAGPDVGEPHRQPGCQRHLVGKVNGIP